MSTADVARGYLRRGWCPIPVPFKSKKPNTPGWQHSQLREEDLEKAFRGKTNIGVILGPKSSGLTDVDLDCPEAVALAPHLLERTAPSSVGPPARTHIGFTRPLSPKPVANP